MNPMITATLRIAAPDADIANTIASILECIDMPGHQLEIRFGPPKLGTSGDTLAYGTVTISPAAPTRRRRDRAQRTHQPAA